MNRLEELILGNLILNEEYNRISLPFIKREYFQERTDGVVFDEISKFFYKHNKLPSTEILLIEVANRTDLSDDELNESGALINKLPNTVTDQSWLLENTENWCKDRSIYLAILSSIKIIEDKDSKLKKDAIPKLLSDALAVSFDTNIGHEYIDDAEARYDYYNRKEEKIPFGLILMDQSTSNGMYRKTVTAVAAESGGGKSIFMTSTAAAVLKMGYNVLYITLEMSEERIGERIDANLLNTSLDDVKNLDKDLFISKIDKIGQKTRGKLYIKEYPPTVAHAGHFRGLIQEYKIKKNFTPDLVIVDYLGICASSRMKLGGSVNSYSYIKAIAEELRCLAVEQNIAMLTGIQLNRSGYNNSDIDLTSTAESMGIVHTLDIIFCLIETEELTNLSQVMIKFLKNRYGMKTRFVIGLSKPKMKFYDLENSAQTLSSNTVPAIAPNMPIMGVGKQIGGVNGFKF